MTIIIIIIIISPLSLLILHQYTNYTGGVRSTPLSTPSFLGRNVVLSPRQREDRELEEADVQRAYGQIAKKFAEKVLEVSKRECEGV